MRKAELRAKYKQLRSKYSDDKLDTLSIAIANLSLHLPIWEKTYYHIFLPIVGKKEVNTEFLLHILQGKDKSICIPKTNFKDHEMSHILLQENTPIQISDYGIPEPTSGIEILPQTLDVIFVPLLAFDEQGNRAGYGKGFYDRFLAQCKPSSLFIGLSFFPPEKHIETEPTDIKLDHCITPTKIYSFR